MNEYDGCSKRSDTPDFSCGWRLFATFVLAVLLAVLPTLRMTLLPLFFPVDSSKPITKRTAFSALSIRQCRGRSDSDIVDNWMRQRAKRFR